MNNLSPQLQADVNSILDMDAVPSILRVISHSTGMGFTAVARVTDERWVACSVLDKIGFGLLPGSELKLESTICHEIRQHRQVVAIDEVATDECYKNHHTPATYGLQSYLSVPIITKDGSFFGTLCAIDPNPAKVNNAETIEMFKLYADLIAFHLDSRQQLMISESRLKEEQQNAELRELFIAILGHDLRNPLGAVANVAQLLLRMPLDERMKRLATILKDSSYRMRGLIDNILDFAKGRLGDGIAVDLGHREMKVILEQVVDELRLINPAREINVAMDLEGTVYCDDRRIAQLFSNLLGNAITHGKKDEPIHVQIDGDDQQFSLSVSNAGTQIPEEQLEQIFEPFSRGRERSDQQGLGLGLYICYEIAKAHSGSIEVSSNDAQTRFSLKIPCNSN